MFFPCKIFDKNGKLKEIISKEKVAEKYWLKLEAVEKFSQGTQQNISYALRNDYIPSTDCIITKNNARKIVDNSFKSLNKEKQ